MVIDGKGCFKMYPTCDLKALTPTLEARGREKAFPVDQPLINPQSFAPLYIRKIAQTNISAQSSAPLKVSLHHHGHGHGHHHGHGHFKGLITLCHELKTFSEAKESKSQFIK